MSSHHSGRNRAGKLFLVTLALLIIMLIFCVFLILRISSLQKQINGLLAAQSTTVENNHLSAPDGDDGTNTILNSEMPEATLAPAATEEPAEVTDSPQPEQPAEPDPAATGVTNPEDSGMRRAEEGEQRYVYLTFDDGPSDNTEQILSILRENNIKATFFVNGRTDEAAIGRYKAIAADGHVLAMHSYTHKYDQVYASVGDFDTDLLRIQDLIRETTGQTSLLYRFPGGSSNRLGSRKVGMSELVADLNARGIRYFDWNVDTTDGSGSNIPVSQLLSSTESTLGVYVYNVVLMHDAGDHDTTVEALPQIIQMCKDKNMIFLPITADTPAVHHNLAD